MAITFNLLAFCCLLVSTVDAVSLIAYAPKRSVCPSTPLVRPANSISSNEATYIAQRKPKADVALAQWLTKTNSGFGTSQLPTVGLTTSGGGYRSLLVGAGVIQGLDSRDSTVVGTAGVFQGITYQSGLSGGAWFLSSLAGNDYPTISYLRDNLWEKTFAEGLLLAPILVNSGIAVPIEVDIAVKAAAGFEPTLVDPYGRSLSYQLLLGPNGGVANTMSGISSTSNYTSHNVPFPIITSLGVNTFNGQCTPALNATQYEFSPTDFGSWDKGVAAFTQTKYLGSSLSNGAPAIKGLCVTNYDNLGYVLGTSSDIFNELCGLIPTPDNTTLPGALATLLSTTKALTTQDEYALYPNPFRGYPPSTLVSSQPLLTLVDGGEALQNNPIWPFLQPARSNVSVLLVNDNSADTSDNFPDGTELFTTYQVSTAAGLTRMPVIPTVAEIIGKGLNKRPTFFGCNDSSKITIVWLPNVNYTFPSNEPTSKLQYTPAETTGMIANGVQVASRGGDKQWPTCLGCGIVKKGGGALPAECQACFEEYCYN